MLRLQQHQNGEGANHTKKRLPVRLIYWEEYSRIDEAFKREKQVQGWSRAKKEVLIKGAPELLPSLAIAYRDLRNGSVPSRTSKVPSNQTSGNETVPLRTSGTTGGNNSGASRASAPGG